MRNFTVKRMLFVIVFLVLGRLVAQPVVTLPPKQGDISTGEYAYVAGVQQGTQGQHQLWDYKSLTDSAAMASVKFVNPAGTAFFGSFPQADLVAVTGDTLFSYYQLSAGRLLLLGGQSQNELFRYSHPYITYAYPLSYGHSFQDSARLYFWVQGQKDTSMMLDSSTVTGSGTLKLPGKTYDNVLQLRHINTAIARFYIPGIGEIVSPPRSDTTYTYFVDGNSSPLLFYSIYNGSIQLISYYKTESLPLRFISFTALLMGNGVQLDWQTADEINTGSFIIQRSLDGLLFSDIGQLASKGAKINQYRFTDNSHDYGPDVNRQGQSLRFYYRLAQIDKDGSRSYSQVITCDLAASTTVGLYPNPTRHEFYLTGVAGYDFFSIYNMTGICLLKGRIKPGVVSVSVENLPTGMYIVKLNSNADGGERYIRFVKK